MDPDSAARPRGRPRTFDENSFLDASITLFSRAGFAGVSMSDLTKASGLTTGSIYKAYKDKEGVFANALTRYIALREAEIEARLSCLPDARAKVANLLRLFADLSRGRDGRLGCMVVSGVADLGLVGDAATILHDQLASRLDRLERLLNEGHADGSISREVDPATTAALLLALQQGMRVLGKVELLDVDREALVTGALRLLEQA
ncbi:TetR/AcrR family transcriptional regulator [Mesobaculum littorinae]|uniref:TetR/AcrR family transcriptional regulator n=1 Tax=Mesobaculum littorinae TaxID=2486419 RepID=A0A438AEN4_9RHOB|nr:TetR/AcrR family transcriptional regulator [Mesobaculum littorinae]RVV97160.1 TetR/AcrR family transcriptional regulator [Mesobaculum littorinae]